MAKQHRIVGILCISLLLLTAVLIAPPLYAGDEDMSPNAYHIFDPETGYMITVESQPDEQQGKATPNGEANATAESINDQAPLVPRYWLYLLVLVSLVAGIVAWKRNKQQAAM